MAGVYVMFLTERLSLDALAAAEEAHCSDGAGAGAGAAGGHAHAHGAGGDAVAAASLQSGDEEAPPAAPEPHAHEHLSPFSAARDILAAHAGHAHGSGGGAGHGHAHAHGALTLALKSSAGSSASSEDAHAAPLDGAAVRRLVTARLLELSIVVHSFIIGLNLGTLSGHAFGGHEHDEHEGHEGEEEHADEAEESSSSSGHAHASETASEHALHAAAEAEEEEEVSLRPIVALIVVLCFHQFFEGVALGSYIADLRAAAPARSKLLMAAIFALTVPAGCWIGIGVASSYDPESQTAVWVTGALNGTTAGMLLYSALITFMAEEFSRDDLRSGAGRSLKRQMYALMLAGAAAMALLALWA